MGVYIYTHLREQAVKERNLSQVMPRYTIKECSKGGKVFRTEELPALNVFRTVCD
jgi:hypothetical protein